MPDVFISYSRADWDRVNKQIREPLVSRGIDVWCDLHGISTAADWEKTIRKALNGSTWFLVAMSRNSSQSIWVHREVAWAMDNRTDNIIPVALDEYNLDDWHIGLRTIQVLPLFEPGPKSIKDVAALIRPQGIEPSKALVDNSSIESNSLDYLPPSLPPELSISAFDYYSYVSVSKVNMLFSQITPPPNVNEQRALTSRIVQLQTKLAINSTADLKATRDELRMLEVIQRLSTARFGSRPGAGAEREVAGLESADATLTKLRTVLFNLIKSNSLSSLMESLSSGTLSSLAYVHRGAHQFVGYPAKGIALIESKLGDQERQWTLRLHASMKYFSDMGFSREEEGGVVATPHSANAAFFMEEGLAVEFISIVIVSAVQDHVVFASPICLILDSRIEVPI